VNKVPKFSENRKYLFERTTFLTPNDTKTTLSDKSNKNWIQNLIKISDKRNSNENKLQKTKSLENSSQIK
jgi:hypothetical protein